MEENKINNKYKEEIYEHIDNKLKSISNELGDYTNKYDLICISSEDLINILRSKITGRTD